MTSPSLPLEREDHRSFLVHSSPDGHLGPRAPGARAMPSAPSLQVESGHRGKDVFEARGHVAQSPSFLKVPWMCPPTPSGGRGSCLPMHSPGLRHLLPSPMSTHQRSDPWGSGSLTTETRRGRGWAAGEAGWGESEAPGPACPPPPALCCGTSLLHHQASGPRLLQSPSTPPAPAPGPFSPVHPVPSTAPDTR